MNNENFTIERNEITYVITDGYPTSFRSTTRKSLSPNDEIFIAFPEDNLNVDNPKKRNHRRRHIAEHFGEDLFYLMDEQAATDIAEFIAEKANTTIYGKTYRDEYEAWREHVDDPATVSFRSFVMWIRPATHWTAEHFMKEWRKAQERD